MSENMPPGRKFRKYNNGPHSENCAARERVKKVCFYFHHWEQSNLKTMFRRGVYLAEHTLQAASVEFVPPVGDILCAQQTAKTCRKAPKGFFDSLSGPHSENCAARLVFTSCG